MTEREEMRTIGYVTVLDAAHAIRRHVSNVYDPVKRNAIEHVRIGRTVYVLWRSVIDWVNRNDARAASLLGLSEHVLPSHPAEPITAPPAPPKAPSKARRKHSRAVARR